MPKFQRLETWPHDKDNAHDARQNRSPAPWADILLQHDGGKDGYEER